MAAASSRELTMKGGSLHTHRALPRQCAIRRLAMWLHQVAVSKEDFRDASPRSSACAPHVLDHCLPLERRKARAAGQLSNAIRMDMTWLV